MEGRCLWIQDGDVEGPVEVGHVVKAARSLSDFCLRGDDGSAPVVAGTLLEIVETRPWGAAMAQELPALNEAEPLIEADTSPGAIMQAAVELEQLGLWEFAEAAG